MQAPCISVVAECTNVNCFLLLVSLNVVMKGNSRCGCVFSLVFLFCLRSNAVLGVASELSDLLGFVPRARDFGKLIRGLVLKWMAIYEVCWLGS